MRTKRMVTIYRSTSTPTVAQKTGRNENVNVVAAKKQKNAVELKQSIIKQTKNQYEKSQRH
jgi:hypothetical protein